MSTALFTYVKLNAGSRLQGNEVIRAKNKCAILLAMGCTTMLTVTPRSLEKMKAVDSISRSNTPDNSRQDIESGWVAVDGKVDDELSTEDPGALSVPVGSRKGRGAPKKKDRPSFTLSLYHGDMVVFYGDDFEVLRISLLSNVSADQIRTISTRLRGTGLHSVRAAEPITLLI